MHYGAPRQGRDCTDLGMEVPGKIAHLLDNVKVLEKELARLKGKLAASQGDDLAATRSRPGQWRMTNLECRTA